MPLQRDESAIWNRAVLRAGGSAPREGDAALAALMLLHSLAMNGGLLDALESLKAPELAAAVAGYRFFGLTGAAGAIERIAARLAAGADPEKIENPANEEYWREIRDDETIATAFSRHRARRPEAYAALEACDLV